MNPNHNAVDRILTGLRDAQPPAGLEQRILHHLEEQTANADQRKAQPHLLASLLERVLPGATWRSQDIPALHEAYTRKALRWVPLATTALVVAAIATRNAHHLQTSQTNPNHTAIQSMHDDAPAETRSAPSASVAVGTAPRHNIDTPKRTVALQRVEAAQIDDRTLISHPAPPIPLTAQEQLLLRYARHGHNKDLAQISNDRKANEEQQNAAAFEDFFTPPTTNTGESE